MRLLHELLCLADRATTLRTRVAVQAMGGVVFAVLGGLGLALSGNVALVVASVFALAVAAGYVHGTAPGLEALPRFGCAAWS